MELADTHCHIDLDAFDEDRGEVVARARDAGVSRMILIGFEPEGWDRGLSLVREVPGLSLAVGLHPTEAERYDAALEEQLRHIAISSGAVAIGETGIDYHWRRASPEAQRHAFERQIALAQELDLPFIVHQRDSAVDVLNVLRAAPGPLRGVMHCFTEDVEYARACIDLGMHIGFGGAVTFKKAREVQRAAAQLPLDRIVLETDAPFMTPSPHRGQRNEPAYLSFILERIAELRDEDPDVIARVTTENAIRLFKLADGRNDE